MHGEARAECSCFNFFLFRFLHLHHFLFFSVLLYSLSYLIGSPPIFYLFITYCILHDTILTIRISFGRNSSGGSSRFSSNGSSSAVFVSWRQHDIDRNDKNNILITHFITHYFLLLYHYFISFTIYTHYVYTAVWQCVVA